jgi:myo-inositol 2-dehydrogenase/D-chiro-inositol 1-dehydrogenase
VDDQDVVLGSLCDRTADALAEQPLDESELSHADDDQIRLAALGEAGDVDTAIITMRFANGAIGTIDNSRKAVYGYDQRVEVFGSGGMVQAYNNTPHNDIYSNADGVQSAKPLYFFLERYMLAYRNELDAFIDAVESGKPTSPSGYDGLMAQRLADAATESWKSGQPVKL